MEDIEVLRHSCSHVMAQAVTRLFPEVKLAIGPAIENGFYYDFDKKSPFVPEDLEKITREMEKIVKENFPFVKSEKTKQEAIQFYKDKNQTYKIELLQEIHEEKVTFYQDGEFVDLCRGPHISSTGQLKYFKLLNIAGAYWRGDEKNPMLQRIYGTAFFTKEELDTFLTLQEEARKRDHRKLGKELDLFSMHPEGGPGLIYWHPRGALVKRIIEDFWVEEHLKNDYQLVSIPHIARKQLWETSGHWDFYRESMFTPLNVDNQEYILKPMNCPGHILIYKTKLRSYRDLPLRWAELGTVYRYEKPGVLHGLMRVRGFTQDDAHIFCRPDQLEEEIVKVVKLCLEMLQTFGFRDYEVGVSTRPEKYVGSLEDWERATEALKKAAEVAKLNYKIYAGEGVFYGPKLDIRIKDSLGRAWQCSTIQVDFNLPQKFAVNFIGQNGKPQPVIMIHRALLGSLERFLGVLIEHYGGAFPLWLAPEQVRILPITERHYEYARDVWQRLKSANLRVEVDGRNESLNLKIREAEKEKAPFILIVGDREVKSGVVAVRRRNEDLGQMKLEEFLGKVLDLAKRHITKEKGEDWEKGK